MNLQIMYNKTSMEMEKQLQHALILYSGSQLSLGMLVR